MKWIDISMPMHVNMQVYKNRQANKLRLTEDRTHEKDHIRESRLEINLHTGTHLDAPLHILSDGNTIESFPLLLSQLPCTVIDLMDIDGGIRPDDLPLELIIPGQAILLKTKNSLTDSYDFQYTYLTAEAAQVMAAKKPALVGIDALGIERDQPGHPTHKALMRAEIWILEGLRLAYAEEGSGYLLNLLPLNLVGAEASPVRAVLIHP